MLRSHKITLFLLLAVTLIGGCVPVIAPDSPVGQLQPRVIAPDRINSLQDGITTAEKVLLELGEPDYAWDRQRVFVYCWATNDVASVSLTHLSRPDGYWPLFINHHFLLIAFDDAGHVSRHQLMEDDSSHRIRLDDLRREWTAAGAKP
ncbi:MAG TPA: hypothetical protein VFE47_23780 [Tepidisphaeraceae bacterium]|nr:hypothetical protein [Tepidisphaeraceae bacterium]